MLVPSLKYIDTFNRAAEQLNVIEVGIIVLKLYVLVVSKTAVLGVKIKPFVVSYVFKVPLFHTAGDCAVTVNALSICCVAGA